MCVCAFACGHVYVCTCICVRVYDRARNNFMPVPSTELRAERAFSIEKDLPRNCKPINKFVPVNCHFCNLYQELPFLDVQFLLNTHIHTHFQPLRTAKALLSHSPGHGDKVLPPTRSQGQSVTNRRSQCVTTHQITGTKCYQHKVTVTSVTTHQITGTKCYQPRGHSDRVSPPTRSQGQSVHSHEVIQTKCSHSPGHSDKVFTPTRPQRISVHTHQITN